MNETGTQYELPDRLGPYRVIRRLGRGGMGTVHQAEHIVNGSVVALKTVLPTRASGITSLQREIHALAQLEHTGIVRILEDGVQSGIPWYAMELVDGMTLRDVCSGPSPDRQSTGQTTVPVSGTATGTQDSWTSLTQHSDQGDRSEWLDTNQFHVTLSVPTRWWDIPKTLRIVYRLCDALAYLHGEGVVHRDLKPNNLIIRDNDMPVLVDFGLAATFAADGGREALFIPSAATGTAAYIAPEQATGQLVDARADLYSLGCILYEMLVGRPPFVGSSPAVIRHQHTSLAPVPPSKLNDRCAPWPGLEELVLRLLEKEPRRRPGHALDVAAVIAPLIQAQVTEESSEPTGARSYLYRPTLVGRTHHLHALSAQIDALESGRGGTVFLTGESGAGKTRLLVELCRAARKRRIRVLPCECPAPPSADDEGKTGEFSLFARPLEPLRPLLRRVADECEKGDNPDLQALLSEQARLLALYEPALMSMTGPLMFDARIAPEHARHRIFASVEQTLGFLTRNGPAILAIDDLQWADELTLGFVRHMIATSAQHRIPVLMLITWRGHGTPAQFASDNVHSVEVDALSRNDVSRMISDMLALDTAPDQLVDFVADRAAGNPFQVGEYLQAAVERNLLQRDQAGDWQLGLGTQGSHAHQVPSLPESMDMLLAQRIDGVPRPAQRVLETSAVIGRHIPLAVLEKALSRRDVDLDTAIHDLLLRGLLEETEPGSLSFTHGQIREVTYSRIPAARRAAIHRAVADALESDGQIADHLHARIAGHRKRAGQPNRAAEAYVEAGRNYAQRFAAKEARRMYEAAIKLLKDRPGQRARITLELVERIILPTENYELAGTRAAKALVTATEQKLPKLAAIALSQIALAEYGTGHHQRAWKRAMEALSMFKEAGRYASHEAAMLELISRCAAERDNTDLP